MIDVNRVIKTPRQMIVEMLPDGCTLKAIRSDDRSRKMVNIRSELAYRLHYEMNWKKTKIGAFLNRDHTSAIYLIKRHHLKSLEWKPHDNRIHSTNDRQKTDCVSTAA